jgi:transposase
MISPQLQVAVDVGCHRHRVAVGDVGGELLEEFDVEHSVVGLADFFARIERLRLKLGWPVAVAMEGYNGWARPLDRQVLLRGWRLYNANNLKLARYKEIFPAPSKSDAIDTRRMLELFRLRGQLRVARNVLQEVGAVPVENDKLKRLTRRRRQLVGEKGRLLNRLQADLQAVCPGLLAITGEADNLWFLSLLACREDLGKIAGLRKSTLLSLQGVGRKYAAVIQAWQKQAVFSPETEWVGPMIVIDAQRVLELKGQIQALDQTIAALVRRSEMARRIDTIPGFGSTCSGELAGEIGALERFASEASLAVYLGMATLDNRSGDSDGTKPPRQVNMRAKAAMMVAVARHVEQVTTSRAFYGKKRAQGKTHNQAVRALGRHLVRVIWSMLKHGRDYELRTVAHA